MYNYPYGDNQQINLNWIISEIIALHQRLDPDYTAPTFTQIYPFSETQQLNLDWILTELKALKELAPTPAPTETIDEVGQALIAGAYDSDTQYQKNDYIVQDGKVYRANAATTGTFDPAKWREVMLGDDLAIITRWADATNTYLNNLAASNVSNDSSVAGDTVKDALGTLNGALSDITATKRITTLSDLDTSVNHFIQFSENINVGGITFPEFSKGVLVTNGGTDATIYAIDVLTGSLFIADRLSGTWRHGRNVTQEISNLNGAINQNNNNIAFVESGNTASQSYIWGAYIVLPDGQLYKVITNISQGDTFTVGTNIEAAYAASNVLGVVVTPTIVEPSYFELASYDTQVVGGFLFGSVSLKCKANVSSDPGLVRFNMLAKPAYGWQLGMITDQWGRNPSGLVRCYCVANASTNNRLEICGIPMTAGQYITIIIAMPVSRV